MAGATWNIYLFILEIFYLQEEMKKKKKDRQTKKKYIYIKTTKKNTPTRLDKPR